MNKTFKFAVLYFRRQWLQVPYPLASRSLRFGLLKLFKVKSGKGQTRALSSENTISTVNNNLSRKGGYLHCGIIAIIVLGCVVSLTVLVGICITAGYLGKRKVVEYIFEREKKFEESSFEMLDLELIPMPERTLPMKRDITSTSKCERETAI